MSLHWRARNGKGTDISPSSIEKKHTQKKRRYALQQINKFSKTKSFAKIIFVFCPLTACGESEEIHMS